MTRSANVRAVAVCCFLAVCFTGFSARLVHLQVTMHEDYAAQAAEKHVIKEPIYAKRGVIEDVHGLSLAQNEPVKTIVADGSLIENHAAVARVLAKPLQMTEAQVLTKLATQRFSKAENKNAPALYIVVKSKVAERVAGEIEAELQEQRLRGMSFKPDSKRNYTNGSLLCHVVGFVNNENSGVEGIEKAFDDYLRAHDGFRYVERDRVGRELVPYRGQERPPRDGFKVRLTVDLGLQQIVEQEIDVAMKQFRPKMAVAILMRPQTGEILALANRPNFDPNLFDMAEADHRRNRAITDAVEPGSMFKIVATTATLTEKLVRPDTVIFCENGYFNRYKLKDSHPYGDLTVQEILIKSSNIGAAKLGIQLGDQKFYEYARGFGFGERTGVQLPGESNGKLQPPHLWSKISLSRLPMGHEVLVTPLQMTAAMAAIANDGWLMMPQIVHEVLDGEGNAIASYAPQRVRQVASREAIKAVQDALVQVVSPKGTARLAAVSGYRVAGKTGTAQKYEKDGRPARDRHLAAFVGYMPAEAPEFVGLVIIDEPQTKINEDGAGLIAAPVFSRIAERAARHLNLVPTPEPAAGELVISQKERTRR